MALALAVVIWMIVLASVILFSGEMGWFPPQISEHGDAIDAQFFYTLIVVAIGFILSQVALGYYVWRYRDGTSRRATYTHGNAKVEVVTTAVTAITFVTLAVLGQKVWAQLHLQGMPEDAVKVEVTAQQFAWNIRYPGPDGEFGRTVSRLINDQINPVGLDSRGPCLQRRHRDPQSNGHPGEPRHPAHLSLKGRDPQLFCARHAFQARYDSRSGYPGSLQGHEDGGI